MSSLEMAQDTIRHLERRLITTVTLDPEQLPEALYLVQPSDLLDNYARSVLSILAVLQREDPIAAADPVAIMQAVSGGLGPSALRTLLAMHDRDSAGPLPYFAKHILAASRRRQLRSVFADGLQSVANEHVEIESVIAEATAHLNGIVAESGDDDCSAARYGAEARTEYRHRKANPGPPGVSTGLHALTAAIGGLQRKKMIVIGARPAMGKSALMLNFIAAAKDQYPVGIISLEMDGTDHLSRLWCFLARIDARRYDEARLTADEERRIEEMAELTAGWSFLIDERAALTWSQIAGRARQWHARHGLRVLVVDYLQLVTAEDQRLPREQQIASISRRAKQLAKELDITVVLLAQLNRSLESRDDKRPRNSDLRESGAIEQDADVIMFIYREIEYADRDGYIGIGKYRERADPFRSEFIIRKNRKRATGTTVVAWRAMYTRFEDLSS